MKITVLVENTTTCEELQCEHGLGLYIEMGDQKILFDAGQSEAFARNAEKLGVDLAQVDLAILSHGHYDHSGGLGTFLERNKKAPVYMSPDAFGPYYDGDSLFIGLDPALKESSRLVFSQDVQRIGPGLTLYSCRRLDRLTPVEAYGLTRREGDAFLPDDFRHEQYLILEEGDKKVCISGCSHNGIRNIVHTFQPDVLIGGFHFMKMEPDSAALEDAARQLLTYPTLYYTGHCTGQAQFDRMKTIMGQRLQVLSTGTIIEI